MGICWSSSSQIKNTHSAPFNSGMSQPNIISSTNTTCSKSNGITFSANSGSSSSSASTSCIEESNNSSSNPNGGQILAHHNLRIFSFAELKVATRNFRGDTVLGEGGFGKVYKGWLDHEKSTSKNSSGCGSVIAVKKLHSESMQGFQEWQSEVHFLGRLSHPNLVKLIGYCLDDLELLLVYEFMQKGSLENHLFGRGSVVQPLVWDIRLKILIGAARGLEFLHNSERQVIYRDFKASNILLDGSYNAKISDFGLAKMGPTGSQSHVTTRVMGTTGYAAPEYVATGHLYVKSDVYGFGVVLVEMLTGMRAMDTNRPSGQHNLIEWIKPYLSDKRKLKHMMDSHLEGRYPSRGAVQIAQLALTCLEPEQKMRPSMKQVLQTLEMVDSANELRKDARISPIHHHYTPYKHYGHHHHQQQQQVLQHRSPTPPRHTRNEEHPSYPPTPPRHTRNEEHSSYPLTPPRHTRNEEHPSYPPTPPRHTRNEEHPSYPPTPPRHTRNEEHPSYPLPQRV